jgi:hypothetical protein
MTKVFFRIEKDGEVLAVFADSWANPRWGCYAHIGQHSECNPYYVKMLTRPAKPDEYASLLNELVAIGYDDLKILQRMPGNRMPR